MCVAPGMGETGERYRPWHAIATWQFSRARRGPRRGDMKSLGVVGDGVGQVDGGSHEAIWSAIGAPDLDLDGIDAVGMVATERGDDVAAVEAGFLLDAVAVNTHGDGAIARAASLPKMLSDLPTRPGPWAASGLRTVSPVRVPR